MILEQILAELQKLNANLASGGGTVTASVGPVNTGVLSTAAQPGLGTQPMLSPPPPPSDITSDKVMALIQPHIGNETIKADLGVAMRAMGINALPETQPHQYGTLYQKFQEVLARHGAGGAPAQTNTSASII